MQLKVSPLAVVPSSVFASLSTVTNSLNLPSLDSSLGDATLALDVTKVNGSLGSANVYGKSDSTSEPVVVNVKAVAAALGILQTELQNLGLSTTVQPLITDVNNLVASLTAGSALQAYTDAVQKLQADGSFELQTAHAIYPGTPQSQSFNVVDPVSVSTGVLPIIQTKALAPYTAVASDGDATANHTVAATSSLDALDVLPGDVVPMSLNTDAIAQLNTLINTLEAALAPAAASAGVTLPPANTITGTVSGTLGSTIDQLTGTVGTVSPAVNSVVPAGTPVSDLTSLLTSLLNLKGALTAMPASLNLSDIVQTSNVASDVTTTVTNGVVDSVATTKAADIKILAVNAPQLTQILGVAQGGALAEIIGATATSEAKADGKTSTATGSGQFTDIKLLPGTPLAQDISFQSLTNLAGCQGAGSTCTVTVGPLQVQILTGVCACIDAAHGGSADAASAAVSALEVKISYLGNLNTLLGLNGTNVANPAGNTSLPGNPTLLADASLATVDANAGQNVNTPLPETGSAYGTGLLVGFLMLVGALGVGLTYRRFAAVKVRG